MCDKRHFFEHQHRVQYTGRRVGVRKFNHLRHIASPPPGRTTRNTFTFFPFHSYGMGGKVTQSGNQYRRHSSMWRVICRSLPVRAMLIDWEGDTQAEGGVYLLLQNCVSDARLQHRSVWKLVVKVHIHTHIHPQHTVPAHPFESELPRFGWYIQCKW